MEYALILVVVLLISPFTLHLAASQKKKTKQSLRVLFLILLSLELILGFFNWETFKGSGKTGFELALGYTGSYLWLFFITALIQMMLLLLKKSILDTITVVLNFINTILFFAAMIILSNLLGKQVVSLVSIGVIFAVLIGNVVGLILVNKDSNLPTSRV